MFYDFPLVFHIYIVIRKNMAINFLQQVWQILTTFDNFCTTLTVCLPVCPFLLPTHVDHINSQQTP